uniref:C-type lectin domain-containing protein n=1 Tax=Xiphophorus couchianus TaxID=32473 RepID=A0A3B5LXQ7_9TELE
MSATSDSMEQLKHQDRIGKKASSTGWLDSHRNEGGAQYLLATFCPSIYYFSSARETWGKSRKDCLERGADLVIINSREEQNFLSRFKERRWIGLTDTEKEGEWKWVDGTRLDTRDENCGEIRFFDEENNWNDVPCEVHNYWICERKLQVKDGTGS